MMNMYKKNLTILIFAVGVFVLACDRFEGGQTVPAYLDIDSVEVVDNVNDSRNQPSGFFTSKIDCVEVTIYFDGDASETTLGVFELPCHIPVLREGVISRLRVSPVVKQNGIAATHIYYPYYSNMEFDSMYTLVRNETTSMGKLTTTYKKNAYVAWSEFFEPGTQRLALDSIVKRVDYHNEGYADTVLSDDGCGVIHIGGRSVQLDFWSLDTIDLRHFSSDSYLYLELDYWNDLPFSVGFKNPMISGGQDVTERAMIINPHKGWNKIYVNLGRLWNYYNHYPVIRLHFSVLTGTGNTGNIYLDNMKLMVI